MIKKHVRQARPPKMAHAALLCAGCGLAEPLWKGLAGVGYGMQGMIYCCEGCAIGQRCFCKALESISAVSYDELEP